MTELLFSTQKYKYLKNALLKYGDFEAGEIEVKRFPDGERYQRILNDVNERNVILIGGTISDEDTLEFYDLACAIEKHGAQSLTMIIPYYGYSTMERSSKPGEVVTAKTRARLLSSIPRTGRANRIIMIDLHTEGLSHYFEGNIRPVNLYAKSLIVEAAKELGKNDFIMACTDAGRAKWVESLANDIGVDAAFVFKRRLSGEKTQITGINADVKGKTVVIYDDMIRTGGSLINAAKAYKEAGAKKIFAITTHGLFTNNALERLRNSALFEKIVSTDTHPNAWEAQNKFLIIKSVVSILYQYLKKIQME